MDNNTKEELKLEGNFDDSKPKPNLFVLPSIDPNAPKPADASSLPKLALAIKPASAFANIQFPDRKFLINPLIQEGSYHLWSGPEGIGKTLFAMTVALALTGGMKLGPWAVAQQVPVLYIDGELTGDDIQKRWTMLDPNWRELRNLYVYSNMHATGDLNLPPAILYKEKWREDLFQVIRHNGFKTIFIDNIMSMSDETDINKFELWAPVNSWALRMRSIGVTVIFLHHLGKSGEQLGTKAREINVDISLRFDRPAGYGSNNGADFVLNPLKARLPLEMRKGLNYRFMLRKATTNGQYEWRFEPPENELKSSVLSLLVNEKMSIREVAKKLNIEKSRVDRIKTKAIDDGTITKNNDALEWNKSG